MNNYKQLLIQQIEALPDDSEQLHDYEHCKEFPEMLEKVFHIFNQIYSKQTLAAFYEADDMAFFDFLEAYFSALEKHNLFIVNNEQLLASKKKEDMLMDLLAENTEKIKELQASTQTVLANIGKLKSQNKTIQESYSSIEATESQYKGLVAKQEQLKKRKLDLLATQEKVISKGFEKLVEEVSSLEEQFGKKEKELRNLKHIKSNLIGKQLKQEKSLQLLVRQTELLETNPTLITLLQAQIETHNQKKTKEMGEEFEGLRIHLKANENLSEQMNTKSSVANLIKQTKSNLQLIDKHLASLIKNI